MIDIFSASQKLPRTNNRSHVFATITRAADYLVIRLFQTINVFARLHLYRCFLRPSCALPALDFECTLDTIVLGNLNEWKRRGCQYTYFVKEALSQYVSEAALSFMTNPANTSEIRLEASPFLSSRIETRLTGPYNE